MGNKASTLEDTHLEPERCSMTRKMNRVAYTRAHRLTQKPLARHTKDQHQSVSTCRDLMDCKKCSVHRCSAASMAVWHDPHQTQ